AFCKSSEEKRDADANIVALLGTRTPVKSWLAASLDKTIKSQLDPVNVKLMTEWVEKWTK
ncbi:MAG: hypothetical protein ACYSW4_03225, partial [Planctomycetota bacterium]